MATAKKEKKKTAPAVVEEAKKPKDFPHYGMWHGKKTIPIDEYGSITVAGCITGCGLAQMSGIVDIGENITAEEFKQKLKSFRTSGCGAIIASLGMHYYDKIEFIESLGFVKIAEYPNYRHGADGLYVQSLYIINL